MFNNIYLKIYSSTLQCIFEEGGEGGGGIEKPKPRVLEFLLKNYHLKGMIQYHLPSQLEHKLKHLEFFLAKTIAIISTYHLSSFIVHIFFKKYQSRSRALRTYHIWDQSILLTQTRNCLKKVATYIWFTYFAIPKKTQTWGWGHTFLKTLYNFKVFFFTTGYSRQNKASPREALRNCVTTLRNFKT